MSIDYADLVERLQVSRDGLNSILKEIGAEKALIGQPDEASEHPGDPHYTNPVPKHMEIGVQYLGMHEVLDNKVLTSFLGIDPHITFWCAYYATACYDNAGMKSLGGVAHDYVDILKPLDEPVFGCACVWKNHIAFFYGYADKTKLGELEKFGKVNSLEDWDKVKCEKDHPHAVVMVMGGNQSDMCNISPAYFYDNYTEFGGYYENVG